MAVPEPKMVIFMFQTPVVLGFAGPDSMG